MVDLFFANKPLILHFYPYVLFIAMVNAVLKSESPDSWEVGYACKMPKCYPVAC